MAFDKQAYVSAIAATAKNGFQKWRPSIEGIYLFKVIKFKEVRQFKGWYWYAELECLRGPEENCVGKRYDEGVNLADESEFADLDVSRMKAIELMVAGIPADVEIPEEQVSDFMAWRDSLMSEMNVNEKHLAKYKDRGKPEGKAEGGVVALKFKKGKKHEPGKWLKVYPVIPYLPAGASIDPENYAQVILEDGSVVSASEAALSAAR